MQRSNKMLETSEDAGTSMFSFIAGDFTYLLMHKTLTKTFRKYFAFYLYSKTPWKRTIAGRYYLP